MLKNKYYYRKNGQMITHITSLKDNFYIPYNGEVKECKITDPHFSEQQFNAQILKSLQFVRVTFSDKSIHNINPSRLYLDKDDAEFVNQKEQAHTND